MSRFRLPSISVLAFVAVGAFHGLGAGPVDAVSVEVTTLTDLHLAYRTLATGPDGQHAGYARCRVRNAGTDGFVVADAVMIVTVWRGGP